MTDFNEEVEDDEMKADVAAWYRDAAPDQAARAIAMRRLLAGIDVPVRSHRRRGWVWAAVPVAVAAAALVAVMVAPNPRPAAPTGTTARSSAVSFEVTLPGQHPHTVALAGDFNGWSPRGLEMVREGSSDRWRITIQLPPGRHVYSFVVDGTTWVIDPVAPRIDTDDLGPANVMAVGQAGD